MAMQSGTCRLCLTTTQLCGSHVIPELCYEGTYDSKHRAKLMHASPNAERWVQKGLRENLLCSTCETRLSRTENWFKTFWWGPDGLPTNIQSDLPVLSIPDMRQFHLFQLAILWRASVATGKEWNTVSLGPYEEKIRQILLDPSQWSTGMYPVFVQALVDENGDVVYGALGKPQQSQYGQSHVYYTLYAGAEFTVFVTESPDAELRKLLDEVYMSGDRIRLLRKDFRKSGTVLTWSRQRREA